MFKQAEYSGRSEVLRKMAELKISQDTLDIVQKIGPSKFLKMAKTGRTYLLDVYKKQYTRWFLKCPKSIRERVFSILNQDGTEMDEKTCLIVASDIITMMDLEDFIEEEFSWYGAAPWVFRYIMDKALYDADVRQKNPLVVDVMDNYLKEAFDVAKAANLL